MAARTLLVLALLWGALGLQGPDAHAAATPSLRLKIALPVPRTRKLSNQLKRSTHRLAALTDTPLRLEVIWGGAAGDEQTVLRKMRAGQLDGGVFTLQTISRFAREALVLESPTLCLTYSQLDAVRAAITPRFDQEAFKNGFKVLLWGDFGKLRYFSTQPLRRPRDFRRARPWMLPGSPVMADLYRLLGTKGIPLTIPEVYGAMETGMLDTYWGTAMIATMLQWHRSTLHMSSGMGFINGALVLTRRAWKQLPQDVATAMQRELAREASKLQPQLRRDDDLAYRALMKRGYTTHSIRDYAAEWWGIGIQLRKKLAGRAYSQALLAEVEQIAFDHADPEHRYALQAARQGRELPPPEALP